MVFSSASGTSECLTIPVWLRYVLKEAKLKSVAQNKYFEPEKIIILMKMVYVAFSYLPVLNLPILYPVPCSVL